MTSLEHLLCASAALGAGTHQRGKMESLSLGGLRAGRQQGTKAGTVGKESVDRAVTG